MPLGWKGKEKGGKRGGKVEIKVFYSNKKLIC